MRIGIDTTAMPDHPVGAGTYILHLTRALAALDEAFELMVFAHRRSLPLLDLQPDNRAQVVEVPDYGRAYRLAWEQTGLPRLAGQQRLDLLHSPHYTMPLASPCPVVVTFHDMTFFLFPELHTPIKRLFFPRAIRASARRARALIADSESTRRDAMRLLGIPPARIHSVPLGVSEAFRRVTDQEQLRQLQARYDLPHPFLLYVGVIEPRKNVDLLLRAFQDLVQRGLPHHLVLAGRFGWMVDEVRRMLEEPALQERVHFLGYVPRQDLPGLFTLASAFVYPSTYEGFGIPVLEAQACGVPVVTTTASSLPEVAGDCALLVPPNNQEALAEALSRLLADPDLQARLARCGPAHAAQFTWERTARETFTVYCHALQASHG